MKKLLVLMSVLMMFVSVSACQSIQSVGKDSYLVEGKTKMKALKSANNYCKDQHKSMQFQSVSSDSRPFCDRCVDVQFLCVDPTDSDYNRIHGIRPDHGVTTIENR